jgi:PPOX class probable F420-dependent enzyme
MARKDITMTAAETHEFLAAGRVLQVASLGRDGWPHLAPMWYVLDGRSVVFRSFTKSQKMVNLARDPRLTVLVERGEAYAELQGVMIKGTARLVADRDYVLSLYGKLAAKYPMVNGAPIELEGSALEAAFGRYAEKNTAVIIDPDRIVSWDHTKLGGAN